MKNQSRMNVHSTQYQRYYLYKRQHFNLNQQIQITPSPSTFKHFHLYLTLFHSYGEVLLPIYMGL